MELGWALPRRLQYFADNVAASKEFHRLEFRDRLEPFPIIRVPIGLPKYRLINGRTSSLQREWLADPKNAAEGDDFFSRDPERQRAQEVQHALLEKLITGKELLSYFKDASNQQKEPIILDSKGFVINGNRRLCTWRKLIEADGGKYAHFAHLDAVVLPPADDYAIDKFEAREQIDPNIKDEYIWHARANMMLDRQTLHKMTREALAGLYKMKKSEVDFLLDMHKYAEEYLVARGKANQWRLVTDKEFAFKKMVEKRKSLDSLGERKLFEEAAFTLIDDFTEGRLYQAIPDLHTCLPKVREKLMEVFKDKLPATAKKEETVKEDVEELLAGGGDSKQGETDLALAELIALPENRKATAEVIQEIIILERSLEKERNSAAFVLKRLVKANTEVQQAIQGIRAESTKDGVSQQLVEIRRGLETVQAWIDG